jgi:hypothetical protein
MALGFLPDIKLLIRRITPAIPKIKESGKIKTIAVIDSCCIDSDELPDPDILNKYIHKMLISAKHIIDHIKALSLVDFFIQ